jgi:hypothetical protein
LVGLFHEGWIFVLADDVDGVGAALIVARPVIVPLVLAVLAVRYIIRLGNQFILMALCNSTANSSLRY